MADKKRVLNKLVGLRRQKAEQDYLAARMEQEALAAEAERLTGALPAVWESWYFDVTGVNERVTPFKLNRPVMMHSTVEVSAGPDLRIVRFPEAPTAMADNRFLRWRRHINETGRIDDHLGRIAGEFPAEDYVDYCDETQRVLAALRTPLVLESVAP